MAMTSDVINNMLEEMDSGGAKWDKRPRENSGGWGGGDPKDRLPIVYVKSICKFTARIVADKNGVLGRPMMRYLVEVPDEEGVPHWVSYTVEGVKSSTKDAEGKTINYTDYDKKDPILKYALQMAKLYQAVGWKYKPKMSYAYYADIVDIEDDKAGNLKKGPCVLVFNGERFKNAYISVSQTFRGKKGKDGKPLGEELYRATVDPTQKGLTMSIDFAPDQRKKGGGEGHCLIAFDSLGGEPDHVFPPEVIAKFADITKEAGNVLGTQNDANGLKILNFYKRRLATSSEYASPDVDEGAKPVASAPAPAPASTPAPSPKEAKAEGADKGSKNDVGDDLAVALEGL